MAFKGDIDQRRKSAAKTFSGMADRAEKRADQAAAKGHHKTAGRERSTAKSYRDTAARAKKNIGKK